jgi:hypothetical protein
MIYEYHIKEKKIDGVIKIELLPWRERMKKVKEILYKNNDGTVDPRPELEQGEMTIDATINQIREVKIVMNDKKISSIEEMMFYREGIDIVNRLGSILMQGISISKN